MDPHDPYRHAPVKRLARALVEFVGFGMGFVEELFFGLEEVRETGAGEFRHAIYAKVYYLVETQQSSLVYR